MANKITEEHIKELYKEFKNYYEENQDTFFEQSQTNIFNSINEQIKNEWNSTSLKGYIVNLIYMLNGKGFKWTINEFAEKYFIDNICNDFTQDTCNNSKIALEEHKKYYKNVTKDKSFNKPKELIYNEFKKENINKDLSMKIKNIILYGAPGVGKTHNYKKLVSLIEIGNFKEKEIFDFIIDNKYDDIEDGTIEKLYKNIENEKRIEFVTFHQSYSYEDFIEGFRPQENGNIELEKGIFRNICKDAEENQNQNKNFYIVIDEINRGNISKIFGELITLIEESKRDNYKVTLPYSKDKFKVPSNLYIIATMNSTDKSIATIDIALRRRFTFLKMKPNSNLVKNSEAKIFMNKLNIYIEKELGEDYMLGHSYFMGDDIDLGFIKEYKIKPLLEEYFYSDDKKSADDIIEEALKG